MGKRVWLLLLAITCSPSFIHAQTDLAASDFDGSGRVDFADFLSFAAAFGLSAADPGFDATFDLDGNGAVDFQDFLVFAGNFGKSTTDVAATYLYVADFIENRVDAVDIATNLTIPARSFTVNFPRGLAIGPESGLVYVASPDTLSAYTETGARAFAIGLTRVENPSGGEPAAPGGFKVRVNSAESLAFVTEGVPGAVEIIDLETRTSVAVVPVGPSPGAMALSADETLLYVGKAGAGIPIIDIAARAVIDSIRIGRAATNKIALSVDGTTLFAAATREDAAHASGFLTQLVAIDAAARTVVDSVQISDPEDLSGQVAELAVNPTGNAVLATYGRTSPDVVDGLSVFTFVGEVVVVGLPGFSISDRIVVGETAAGFGVAPDGAIAYVSGSDDLLSQLFRIFIVDLTSGERLSQLPITIQSASEFVFRSAKTAVGRVLDRLPLSLAL